MSVLRLYARGTRVKLLFTGLLRGPDTPQRQTTGDGRFFAIATSVRFTPARVANHGPSALKQLVCSRKDKHNA
jgi:hypothetical protein